MKDTRNPKAVDTGLFDLEEDECWSRYLIRVFERVVIRTPTLLGVKDVNLGLDVSHVLAFFHGGGIQVICMEMDTKDSVSLDVIISGEQINNEGLTIRKGIQAFGDWLAQAEKESGIDLHVARYRHLAESTCERDLLGREYVNIEYERRALSASYDRIRLALTIDGAEGDNPDDPHIGL